MSRRVKDYFDQVSSQWDTLRKGLYGDEVREAIINAAKLGPDDTVLDVGAGTGFLTEAAAKVGGKVIALDLSKSMTDEAISKLGGKNVEFKVGSVERIPLGDSSVDTVVGNMFLHHSPDPEKAIQEMSRVLTPGGRIVFADMQEHQQKWLRTEKADLWLGFKMEHVDQMLRKAGIADVKVEALGSCCTTTKEDQLIEIPMFLASGTKPS
ncbi:MAG: methyltransferase domain-containing protein [Thermoproteota archaeon]